MYLIFRHMSLYIFLNLLLIFFFYQVPALKEYRLLSEKNSLVSLGKE